VRRYQYKIVDVHVPFETTVTGWPCWARRSAQDRPAAPLPRTSTSEEVVKGGRWSVIGDSDSLSPEGDRVRAEFNCLR